MNNENNWMYSGSNEWTISVSKADYGNSDYMLQFNNALSYVILGSTHYYSGITFYEGNVYGLSASETAGVRPVFYLNSDVKYKNGDGSKDNPFRIN